MKIKKFFHSPFLVIFIILMSCNNSTEVEKNILKVSGHVYDANNNNPFGDVPITAFTTCDTTNNFNTRSNASNGIYVIEINMNDCVGDLHSWFRAPNYEVFHLLIEGVKGNEEYTRDIYLTD